MSAGIPEYREVILCNDDYERIDIMPMTEFEDESYDAIVGDLIERYGEKIVVNICTYDDENNIIEEECLFDYNDEIE